MYTCHVIFRLRMSDIGNGFGRDRTTVLHACHLIENLRDDAEFDAMVASFKRVAPRPSSSMAATHEPEYCPTRTDPNGRRDKFFGVAAGDVDEDEDEIGSPVSRTWRVSRRGAAEGRFRQGRVAAASRCRLEQSGEPV